MSLRRYRTLYCPDCGAPSLAGIRHAAGCRFATEPEPASALAAYRARERAKELRRKAAYHLGRRRAAMRQAREWAERAAESGEGVNAAVARAVARDGVKRAVKVARQRNGSRVRCLAAARAEEVKHS